MPAFMTKIPTQEEIDNNPALAALQALKYEDEDLVGKALGTDVYCFPEQKSHWLGDTHTCTKRQKTC